MSEYVIVLENKLKEVHETTRKNFNGAAKRQKMTYDVIIRPVTYEVGDLVWPNQKRNAPGIKSKRTMDYCGKA